MKVTWGKIIVAACFVGCASLAWIFVYSVALTDKGGLFASLQ